MLQELTPRQLREREYYDQYADGHWDLTVTLDPILGKERRPWNSYWRQFELVKERFHMGARLLDFGCGPGNNTVVFAAIGYDVSGFDISQNNIRLANELAAKHGVADRMHLTVQTAEGLDYADNTFDVVAGVDILHHVDVAEAMRQCQRVLKPGGAAIFREPIYSPVFDPLRNSAILRRAVSNEASFERHITEDEKKLSQDDLVTIRKAFPDSDFEFSRVFSRMSALWGKHSVLLEKIDHRFRHLPGMNQLSGYVVLVLRKS